MKTDFHLRVFFCRSTWARAGSLMSLAGSLMSMAAGSAQGAGVEGRGPVELNSSIITIGENDIVSNRCVEMVDRAASFKQSRLMFVPTLFWVQNGNGPVEHYCYDRYQGQDGKFRCDAANQGKLEVFKSAMQRCFQRAVDANLSIAITPHLDDGLAEGRWRNTLIFDPLEKKKGYSYAEAILYPLVDALTAVVKEDTKVYFGMQGEMSATVFRHPKSWRLLAAQLKDRVGQARGEQVRRNFQVGVSTNFNKLCGCVGVDIIDPQEFVRNYPVLWEKVKGEFDLKEIVALFETVDYFGMSSYPSLNPNFPTSEVENAIYQFDFEFKYFGLSVNDLIKKGKKLHLSEYGLGGGVSQNGDVKANNAAEAAKFPFFGIFGSYKRDTDPWGLAYPNNWNEVREYQRYFYGKTLEYLRSDNQYKYQVDAAFIWNQSSWDVQGIYPESTSAEGSYHNPVIVDMINKHNSEAMSYRRD